MFYDSLLHRLFQNAKLRKIGDKTANSACLSFPEYRFWFGSGFIYARINLNLYTEARQKKKALHIFLLTRHCQFG